jgi:hypothetical protein
MQIFPVNIVSGSHVWVVDPEVIWIDGEVVEVNGEEIKINCTSGKTVSASIIYPTLNACKEVVGVDFLLFENLLLPRRSHFYGLLYLTLTYGGLS